MGQYTSYWLYQKYETRGSQEPIPCYPNVYSVDGDGTMPLVVRKEDDTQCGYVPPIVVKYRWVNIPITQDFICDECSSLQFRWVRSDDTICIEEEPQTIYRWVNMDVSVDYYCEGTTKYYKQKKQVSYDSGLDWEDVTPPEYQRGDVAETESTDCGYVPPTPKKLVVKYSGNITREVECNDNSTLTNGETKPSGYQYTAMTSAFIGDCVGTVGDYTFRDCTSLTSVTISNGVGELGSTVFGNCTNLTSITIPDSCYRIGYGVFNRCTSLTSITMPNSVTRIGELAFVNCSGLTSINIPSRLTRVETETFERCSSLTSVTIPSGVTFIGRYAFSECSGLTSVTVLATTPPTLGNYAFDDTNNCPILVPSQSVSAYKSATNWSRYSYRIQAIP